MPRLGPVPRLLGGVGRAVRAGIVSAAGGDDETPEDGLDTSKIYWDTLGANAANAMMGLPPVGNPIMERARARQYNSEILRQRSQAEAERQHALELERQKQQGRMAGRLDPSDYTVESWARYREAGDESLLEFRPTSERFQPSNVWARWTDENGNVWQENKQTGERRPAVNPETGEQLKGPPNFNYEQIAGGLTQVATNRANVPPQQVMTPDQVARGEARQERVKLVQQQFDSLESLEQLENRTITDLTSIAQAPVLDHVLGFPGGLAPDWMFPPGTPHRDLIEDLKFYQSNEWVEMIRKAKASKAGEPGATFGNLSNAEGTRLEAAATKLTRARTPDSFRKALAEIVELMELSKTRRRQTINKVLGEDLPETDSSSLSDDEFVKEMLKRLESQEQ